MTVSRNHLLDRGDPAGGSNPKLHVVPDGEPAVDLPRAELAVAELLAALGQGPAGPGPYGDRWAEHLCMSVRGVRAAGARTVTSSLQGLLRQDPRSRQEFLALTGGAG
jgi:GTP cyclohydrolase I